MIKEEMLRRPEMKELFKVCVLVSAIVIGLWLPDGFLVLFL